MTRLRRDDDESQTRAVDGQQAAFSWPIVSSPEQNLSDVSTTSNVLRWILSIIWTLLPFLTIGWLSGPCFLYAAIRLRSSRLRGFTVMYFSLTAVALYLLLTGSPHSWHHNAAAIILFCTGCVATCHCLIIVDEVVSPEKGPETGWLRRLS